MTLSELQQKCHYQAHNAGWWDDYYAMSDEHSRYYLAARYALIHSEVSEALEGLRKGGMDPHLPHRKNEEVELADAVIRILDYAHAVGFDLEGTIQEKLAYNLARHDHTRAARAAEGGKKL